MESKSKTTLPLLEKLHKWVQKISSTILAVEPFWSHVCDTREKRRAKGSKMGLHKINKKREKVSSEH